MYRNVGAAHTLSLVLVGALTSSPTQALHFVHFNAFDALVNFPRVQVVHCLSVVSLPRVAYVPAEQFVYAVQPLMVPKPLQLAGAVVLAMALVVDMVVVALVVVAAVWRWL